jgi:hypothetical protein
LKHQFILQFVSIIEANWLNDRDQFLNPNDNWKADKEFQNDCLTSYSFQQQHSDKVWCKSLDTFHRNEVNAKENLKVIL